MIHACQHEGVLDHLLEPVANGSRADPTRCHLLRLRYMQNVRARFDMLLRDIQYWFVKEDNLALNLKRRDGRAGRDADGDGLRNEKKRRKLIKEAKRLAKKINYGHGLSRDKRFEYSMRLSIIQKKLGAMGVERSLESEDEDFANNARQYQFQTDSNKLRAFNDWLELQLNRRLLQAYQNNEPWIFPFVEEAYKKGFERAYDEVNRLSLVSRKPEAIAARRSFLSLGLGSSATSDKLKILATRSFEGMKNLSQAMKADLNRILVDGMANKLPPSEIAKEIRESIDISQARAERIVRTETTYVHAEGQLDSFAKLNIDEVVVEAEWITAAGVCPACSAMSKKGPYRIREAHGLIPYHPNCRCAWMPVFTVRNFDPDGHYDPSQPRDRTGKWTRVGGGIRFGLTGPEDYTRVYRGGGGGRMKVALAKQSHRPVDKRVRDLSKFWADDVSRAVGIEPPKDEIRGPGGAHKPFDIVGVDSKGKLHGIEAKIIQPGKKPYNLAGDVRPEVKDSSIALKRRDARRFKMKIHMVVVDLRFGKPYYYYDDKITRNGLPMRQYATRDDLKKIIGKLKAYKPYYSK